MTVYQSTHPINRPIYQGASPDDVALAAAIAERAAASIVDGVLPLTRPVIRALDRPAIAALSARLASDDGRLTAVETSAIARLIALIGGMR